MANPLAESILALFAGGAQGYNAGAAKRQAQEQAQGSLEAQLAERRATRAQAGQEVVAGRAQTASIAEANRNQLESQFIDTTKLKGTELVMAERHNKAMEKIAGDTKVMQDQYMSHILNLEGQIVGLKGAGAKTPRDYANEQYMKTVGTILANPDITTDPKKIGSALQRLKIMHDIAFPPEVSPGVSGYGPPASAALAPEATTPDFTTTTAPWFQNLMYQIGQFATGGQNDFITQGIRNIVKKKIKTLTH